MATLFYLLLITQIILTTTEPIDEGTDVGTIKFHDGKAIVQNPGKFPYVVYLKIESYTISRNPFRISAETSSCVGVLLKRDIVLTAAHCADDADKRPKITAWLGILDTELDKGKGEEILVKGFTVHHNFIHSNEALQNINDIALFWLWHPARLDGKFVKLANLPTENFDAVDKRGWIIGWGCLSCGKTPTMLQKAVVRGVSWKKCQTYYKQTKLVPTFICVMADNQKATSTSGDSGGPFVVQGMIVGISSFGAIDWSRSDEEKGITASDSKKPAAYTYVPKYLDWIQNTLEKEPEVKLLGPPPKSPPPTRPRSPTRPQPSRAHQLKPKGPPAKISKKTHV